MNPDNPKEVLVPKLEKGHSSPPHPSAPRPAKSSNIAGCQTPRGQGGLDSAVWFCGSFTRRHLRALMGLADDPAGNIIAPIFAATIHMHIRPTSGHHACIHPSMHAYIHMHSCIRQTERQIHPACKHVDISTRCWGTSTTRHGMSVKVDVVFRIRIDIPMFWARVYF